MSAPRLRGADTSTDKDLTSGPRLCPVDDFRADLELLYRERRRGFQYALTAVTGDRESAGDAVQEAFARAMTTRRRLRNRDRLAPWVWTIALRVALDGRRLRDLPSRDVAAALPESARDPDLVAAIRALPPRRRTVLFLYYFADLDYQEIAELCEVSTGTVAATLSQAREGLLRDLQPEGAIR